MKIREVIKSFKIRRNRQISSTNLVSFEAFYNDRKNKFSNIKEPCTKTNSFPSQNEEYAGGYIRFKETSEEKPVIRPSLPIVLVIFILTSVFIVLPIIYLINCFKFSFDNQEFYHRMTPAFFSNATKEYDTKKPQKFHDLPFPPNPDYNQCKLLKDIDKYDCFPEDDVDAEKCEARGCCWIPKPKNKPDQPIDVPYCFYPPNYNTYKIINITETSFGLIAFWKRQYRTAYPDDVEVLKMIVKYETETRLRVKIVDPNNFRFESPYPEVPIVDKASISLTYIFEINIFKSGFKVMRKSDNTTIFDSNNFLNLIYSNQLLQISSKLPSKFIYGIGEHRSNLLLSTEWSRFTLFNHDEIPTNNKNLYGSHPFYLVMENSTKSHGVFLLNSNAMDVILQPTPAITFRTIGGILDFYFFLGPSPSEVINQYTDLIGRPYMPPYWSLGFHLCRFGYKTLNETKKVMQRNIDAGIPLDTQWNDLDYMNVSNDFTYDHNNFKELPSFVNELHLKGMHYIPLIDPGISASETPGSYPPYDVGMEMDIFVKNSTGLPFIGKVWNRVSTVWPDFTNPNAVDYWTLMLKNMHKTIQFDGAWIDMNEPSNFYSGANNGCSNSTFDNPPYLPYVDGGIIYYKTLCMAAKHYAGLHYNVHNLYGLTEAIVTSFALAEIRGKRPMVISRSSFSGLGHYAGHWSGDVWSSWDDMKFSIPGILSFSLYGIPLMGADICGFNGNTTAPLCNRWMQLGAFYPFSRNHNTDDGIDQDPVALGKQVIASSVKALTARYYLLPYLYTLFHKAHVNGETVARPLFFEFPEDVNTYGIDTQFLWGSALMIIPVLQDSDVTVTAYIPKGTWYDFYNLEGSYSKGEKFTLDAPLDTIPLLIRGGCIVPLQAPKNTTTESRKSKIELLVASDEKKYAIGDLYWDDGDSLNSFEEKQYSSITFELEENTLRSYATFIGSDIPPNLDRVAVLGIDDIIKEVSVNGFMHKNFDYNSKFKYLNIEKLDISLQAPLVISWK
ncbi:lysosomal alpha-glucosidase-like [Diorhabda carinulata]|uniref:lysosomal alpha-glucosidase-like n=1 Tax=Diorhabda carinulata TaxID=1163345 RepID=UPI0025A20DB4|nr:lysosomal alpha-glucosidase-like [Diorhabda carinulata]XP_057662920.1 lysosomal alpha-glucosidase-like [Diorhabda carinulata]